MMMEAVCTSETSVDNHFTRQYIPEDNSESRTKFVYSDVSAFSHSDVIRPNFIVPYICRPPYQGIFIVIGTNPVAQASFAS
jgi:hypothetical protein